MVEPECVPNTEALAAVWCGERADRPSRSLRSARRGGRALPSPPSPPLRAAERRAGVSTMQSQRLALQSAHTKRRAGERGGRRTSSERCTREREGKKIRAKGDAKERRRARLCWCSTSVGACAARPTAGSLSNSLRRVGIFIPSLDSFSSLPSSRSPVRSRCHSIELWIYLT